MLNPSFIIGLIIVFSLTAAVHVNASSLCANLPCLPCMNGGTCNTSNHMLHTASNQTFGSCRCAAGYQGDQCQLVSSAVCSPPCKHNGTCIGGVCQCPTEFDGSDCSLYRCLNQGVVGVATAPDSLGSCGPCAPGYTGSHCQFPSDDAMCPSGEFIYRGSIPVGHRFRAQCASPDPAWVNLNQGNTSLLADCFKPTGWDDAAADGQCHFQFLRRSSYSFKREETFHCTFKKCNRRVVLSNEAKNTLVQTNATFSEPAVAITFRVFLLVASVTTGAVAALPISHNLKTILVPISLAVTALFLLLSITVGGILTEKDNADTVQKVSTFGGDASLRSVLACEESKCSCNDFATDVPSCSTVTAYDQIINSLKGRFDLECNNKTGSCTFIHVDLFAGSFTLNFECETRYCSDGFSTTAAEVQLVTASDAGPAGAIVGSVLGGLTILLVVGSIVYHLWHRSKAKATWDELMEFQDREKDSLVAAQNGSYVEEQQQGLPLTTEVTNDDDEAQDNMADNNTDGEKMMVDGSSAGMAQSARCSSVGSAPLHSAARRNTFLDVSAASASGFTVPPFIVEAKNICYTAKLPTGEERLILNDINITLAAGRLTGILAPSGAGKTTLLDIIAQRSKVGKTSGEVLLDGKNVRDQPGLFTRTLSYVADEDSLLPTLTTREALEFSAALRLPVAIEEEERQTLVTKLLSTFHLSDVENSVIGRQDTSNRSSGGLSHGERRRLHIAVMVVAFPRLLLLDEPTSGLDSYNAKLVVECLRDLSSGSWLLDLPVVFKKVFPDSPIVALTIHQPSDEMFELFDDVILLSKGRFMYCGPQTGVTKFLKEAGFRSDGVTPDLCIEAATIASEETLTGLGEARKSHEDATAAMMASQRKARQTRRQSLAPSYSTNQPSPQRSHQQGQAPEENDSDHLHPFEAVARLELLYPPFFSQCSILFKRGWIHLLRQPEMFTLHFLVSAFLTFLVSLMYSNTDKDISGTLAKAGLITFYLLWLGLVNLSALELFLGERTTFVSDRHARCYSTVSYFVTKLFLDLILLRLLPTVIGGSLFYFPVVFRPEMEALGFFIGVTMLFTICVASISIAVAAVVPSFGSGVLVNGFILIVGFAFSGLISSRGTVPAYIDWIRYLSPFSYAYEAIMVRDLHGQLCFFAPRDPNGNPLGPTIPLACDQFLFALSLKPENESFNVAMIAAWSAVYLAIALMSLAFFTRGRR